MKPGTPERRALRGLAPADSTGQAEAARLGSGNEADRRFVRVLSLVVRIPMMAPVYSDRMAPRFPI
ncbi:hypothetical protein J2D73_03765 [Acetobacter sacchari]|uniref:Uncharacterized protein n=1 Tax=Acetobacter sacchari TaxID=2661687 RepID=A0ABS3LSM1_9PROT|nr:hypothetical protein [Acetobacter sacchari]